MAPAQTSQANNRLLSAEEYRDMLWHVSGAIDHVVWIYQSEMELRRLARESQRVYMAVNSDAGFWVPCTACFQTTLFVSLHCLFEDGSDVFGVVRLLRETLRNPHLFSPEALRAREAQATAIVEQKVLRAWKFDARSIRLLKREFAERKRVFDEIYRPIRHQVIAHSVVIDKVALDELYGRTNLAQLGELLLFLRQLVKALEDLYLNCNEPILQGDLVSVKSRNVKGLQNVLQKVASFERETPAGSVG